MFKFAVFFEDMGVMEDMIKGFAGQLKLGLEPVEGLEPISASRTISSIVVIGMGGSAFGGEVIRNYLSNSCKIPILVCRDYEVPAAVGTGTLLIVSSYSGDTEETLSALATAIPRDPMVIAISSGGKLENIAAEHHFPFLRIPGGLPPRVASGYSISRLLQIIHFLGLSPDYRDELKEAIQIVSEFNEFIAAAQLASEFAKCIPVFYSGTGFECTAIRWRQQIEENAKKLAFHHVIPEMNHNELVGWMTAAQECVVVLLKTDYDHPRVKLRMDYCEEVFREKAGGFFVVHAKGKSRLAQIMYLIHFGDWVSLYLAEEMGVEPVPVEIINQLKSHLENK